MRSDVLAMGLALILFVIRLIVFSLQGLVSQVSVVMCFVISMFFFVVIRPSTDVITDLGYIRTYTTNSHELIKVKKEEQPNKYVFYLITSWIAGIAVAIFMFTFQFPVGEFTRVK